MAGKNKKKGGGAAKASGGGVAAGGGGGKDGGQATPGKSASGRSAGSGEGPGVEELFSKLEGHIRKSEFSRVVKTADEILAASPGDADALRCKAVALIQNGSVADALKLLQAPNAPPDMAFEKAYCLYRLNRLSDSLDLLRSIDRTADTLQLEGQVLYRLGDSAACISRFEELFKKHRLDQSQLEVKTNVLAAYVMGGRSAEVKGLMESQLRVAARDAFDVAYNSACALIEMRDFRAAEEMLLLARRVGQEVLIDEELSTQEIEDELAPITVQLAYTHQMLGRRMEALESYVAFLKRKPADAPSAAVAVTNLLALRGARDVVDGLKRLDRVVAVKESEGKAGKEGGKGEGKGEGKGVEVVFLENLETKLSRKQKAAVVLNRFLLLVAANRLDEARASLPCLERLLPDTEDPLPLHAALLIKEGRTDAVPSILASLAAASPATAPADSGSETGGAAAAWGEAAGGAGAGAGAGAGGGYSRVQSARLLSAQAAAMAGQWAQAAGELGAVEGIQHRPAVVATLMDLKERAGDVAGAEAVVDAAVEWWRNHMDVSSATDLASIRESLLRAAAEFKARHGAVKGAADDWQALRKMASTQTLKTQALAGLVSCTAQVDPATAEKLASELPPMPGTSGLDVSSLLQRPGPSAFSHSAAAAARAAKRPAPDDESAAASAAAAASERARAKKKRKRKVILPKGFDPANPGPPPDPERWLPRRERSSFRPKKKDKRKVDVRGAQGAAVVKGEKAEGGGVVGGLSGDGDGGKGGGKTSAAAAAAGKDKGGDGGKKKGGGRKGRR
ncbi:hypothetical protein CLOM_g19098 [Closterium sp. NIES-68]|nr:hypothetical protein CLOM_g19098 [Closterium sp. NIES-68]GJP64829.1 hypothetical protein CLOP_g21772 [Closterium sp. NIES-67]